MEYVTLGFRFAHRRLLLALKLVLFSELEFIDTKSYFEKGNREKRETERLGNIFTAGTGRVRNSLRTETNEKEQGAKRAITA